MSDIHIKPENRGKFTALKERTGHSATWFKEHGTPAQKKMAVFALNARKWNHADGGEILREDPPYSTEAKIGSLDNATPRHIIESFLDHPLTTMKLLRERNAKRKSLQSPSFGGGSFSGGGAGGYWVEGSIPAALDRMEEEKMRDKIIYSPGPAAETSVKKTFGQIYGEHKAAGDEDFWLDGVHYLVKDDPSVKPGAVRYHNVKEYVPTVIREVEDGSGNVLLDSTKTSFYSGQQLGKFNRADDPNEIANSLNGLPFYNGKNTKADGGLLISPERKKLLDRINSSKADFIQRMKDPNRAFITNPDGTVSTHRMAYVTNGDDAIVYPEIQNIGGDLVEVPADMAYQSAVDRGDTLHMTPSQAKWFTRKYKKFYPFKMYAPGGSLSGADTILYDYLSEVANPMAGILPIVPDGTSPAKVTPVERVDTEIPDISTVMSYIPVTETSPAPSDASLMDRMAKIAGMAASTAALRRSAPSPIKRIIMPEETQSINTEYTPSENLIQSLMIYEGFKDRPYNKLDGKWTIGYGDTDKDLNDYYLKNKDKRYSREEAEKRLRDRVATEFVGYAKKYTPNWDKLTTAQKDSLVSYIYNIGPGSYSKKHPKLMKALREMNMKDIAANIDAGFNDESKPGLRKRRIAERQAFLHPETEYYGQKFSVGGTLERLENAYNGDTAAMLEAVRKARIDNL